MRKSLSLRMFPDAMPIRRRVELAAAAGFHGVEVNLEPWQEVSLASSDDDLRDLRRMIEAHGLCVSTVYSREQWHTPMSSPDPDKRARCRQVVEALARAAMILGAGSVLIMPGATDTSILAPEPEIVPYDVAYRNALETLRELGRTAGERYRVQLAAENCPGKFLVSPLEFAHFLDEVDSPWVGACLDTGNALWYGFPEHWIPVLGPRVRLVHLKDNRIVGHSGVVPTPLLAGDVNWPAVQESLRGIGYESWVTAEVFPPYRHHPERLIYETSASMDAILGSFRS